MAAQGPDVAVNVSTIVFVRGFMAMVLARRASEEGRWEAHDIPAKTSAVDTYG